MDINKNYLKRKSQGERAISWQNGVLGLSDAVITVSKSYARDI